MWYEVSQYLIPVRIQVLVCMLSSLDDTDWFQDNTDWFQDNTEAPG